MLTRTMRLALLAALALALAIQLVPYGRNHSNPPVHQEPVWQGAETRALAVRACFDCHSNETVWPWYSNVAPVSWLIQYDVDEGRQKLNYSEWDRPQKDARESAKEVREGEMPPWYYALPRPRASLSSAELATLAQGLEATFGSDPKREKR